MRRQFLNERSQRRIAAQKGIVSAHQRTGENDRLLRLRLRRAVASWSVAISNRYLRGKLDLSVAATEIIVCISIRFSL
jgi:hypothetical protein